MAKPLARSLGKVVQERLGHAKIELTLGTYSHLLPGIQRAAADRLDEMLGTAQASFSMS